MWRSGLNTECATADSNQCFIYFFFLHHIHWCRLNVDDQFVFFFSVCFLFTPFAYAFAPLAADIQHQSCTSVQQATVRRPYRVVTTAASDQTSYLLTTTATNEQRTQNERYDERQQYQIRFMLYLFPYDILSSCLFVIKLCDEEKYEQNVTLRAINNKHNQPECTHNTCGYIMRWSAMVSITGITHYVHARDARNTLTHSPVRGLVVNCVCESKTQASQYIGGEQW